MAETKDELPALPEMGAMFEQDFGPVCKVGYTADQMRAYAREAVATAASKLAELQREVELYREFFEADKAFSHARTAIEVTAAVERRTAARAAIDASLSSGRSGSGDGGMG